MANLSGGIAPAEPGARRRLGLALSGGGFRTALFHLGVLLRLAELGILKHVAVISTVSGGSIVGSAFYLRLLALLQRSNGAGVSDREMVALVTNLARDFQRGIGANLRTRALESYSRNVRMSRADY